MFSIRTILATVAAVPAFALGLVGCTQSPAHATEPASVHTYSYVVTDSETTSVDLNITYQDNLDYELDHLDYDPDQASAYGCEKLGLRANDGYLYTWYECYDIPAAEAPEWVKASANQGPGSPVEYRGEWS